MENSHTLVFDIGKTTKKVLLFDWQYQVIAEQTEHFAETADDDGFPCEDLQAVSAWVRQTAEDFLARDPHISALNFSAYGASLAHLDKRDRLITPFYNYLKPFPPDCRSAFVSAHDPAGLIPVATASPWLGMLNSGLQLYWLKTRKPAFFDTIATSLHLPQYFSFLITGKKFSDITSVGCHTLLWDFKKQNYHQWVYREGLSKLFPAVQLPDHAAFSTLKGKKIKIGTGVHDSSAALMPYLVCMREKFLLLSTGTWNITFNPFNHQLLSPEELQRDCLSYLTFQGNPVKASRIFLGHEHELQAKAIAEHFHVPVESLMKIAFDERHYDKADRGETTTIYPLGMEGTGPLPERVTNRTTWRAFASAEEAYHAMMRQLVKWQMLSIDLINPDNHVKNIIVVGGFAANRIFLESLKREARNLNVLVSDHPRAAALGAAWLVNDPFTFTQNGSLLNISNA